MIRRLTLAAIGPVLLVLSAPPATSLPAQDDGTLTPPSPIPRKVVYSPEPFMGTVTAITAETITVRGPRAASRRFAFSPHLAAGGVWPGWSWDTNQHPPVSIAHPPGLPAQYRARDVQVGDVVAIEHSRVDGVDTCDDVCIYRRPGGRVPPAPDESPDQGYRWHERMNAYQDLEEKGIPLPAKYAPVKRVPPTERPAVKVPDTIRPAK
jgi:hypothetical protein